MADFLINGVAYRSGPLDGRKQIHVAQKLLPAANALVSVITDVTDILAERQLAQGDAETPGKAITVEGALAGLPLVEHMADVLRPVMRELAAISPANLDYVMDVCMGVTERMNPVDQSYLPVRHLNGTILNIDDDKPTVRMLIVWHVVKENATDMFRGFGLDVQKIIKR